MGDKERQGLEALLRTVVLKLEESIERVMERTEQMKQYEGSGSVEGNELKTSLEVGRNVQDYLEDPESRLSFLICYFLHPESRDRQLSTGEMRSMKAELLQSLAETKAVHEILDRLEEKFRKYNLPKRGSCESLEPYLARVRAFTRVTWREPAEDRRRKGYKCLVEWMAELDRSCRVDRREAFDMLRLVMVVTGVKISRHLVEYLWMISGERLILEVETVIRCLSIEPEGSVVIEAFASVVELFDRTMRTSEMPEPGPGSEGSSSSWKERETEVFRMILIEILRLEVSFRSPDLPMFLLSGMYIAMADHLMKNVFKDKLEAISAKMNHLQTESRRPSITEFFEKVFNSGIKEIWKLALDPN